MLFSINCIEKISMDEIPIKEKNKVGECDEKLFKGLKSRRYFLNDFYFHDQNEKEPRINTHRALDENFFGPHINVQAVVGENGSGKSSLMELIYIAINNFSYMFERGHDNERPGAESLYYVPGLFVRVYFSIGKKIYILESKGLILDLFCRDYSVENCKIVSKAHFVISEHELVSLMTDEGIANLIEEFFYTIVSNYSLQSFIPTNYIHDVYVFESGRDRKIEKEDAVNNVWINSIFHKNDGYIRSIVLNPYRNNGNIDITNELALSKDRVAALFLWAKQKGSIYFKPYTYYNLRIELRQSFLKNKIKKIWKLKGDEEKQFDEKFQSDEMCLKIINWKLAEILKNHFELSKETDYHDYKKRAMLYLQLKIITIVNKYDSFLGYKNVVTLEKKFDKPMIEFNGGIGNLIVALNDKESHVTKKIMRTIWFLKLSNEAVDRIFAKDCLYNGELYFDELSDEWIEECCAKIEQSKKEGRKIDINEMSGPFTEYKKEKNREFTDPVWIDRILPPSLFHYELFLEKEKDVLPFNGLSSGELQLLETISIHSYHIENILSAKREYYINRKKRFHPKYRCVNMIFDEAEMCFHPDFQRQFVSRMLDLIVSMKQNWYESGGCCINIIILTHSPFILSDIPNSNILYLQDGNEIDVDELITFGSNINDLLYHSFFLGTGDKGFVGEFAKSKIKSLSDFFINKKTKLYPNSSATPEWTEKWANSFLETIVGDEMIKNVLRQIKES